MVLVHISSIVTLTGRCCCWAATRRIQARDFETAGKMRRLIVVGSLMAAGVSAQAATTSVSYSDSNQSALIFVDGGLGRRGRDNVQSRTSFLPGGPAVRPTNLQHRASNFISSLFTSWSSTNAQALRVLKGAYEDPVTYYGKVISREAVLDDKRRFVERWPQRTYTVRPGTLIVQCGDDSGRCKVSGTTDWVAAGEAKRSTGAANFYYAVRAGEGGVLKIAEEASKVVHGSTVSRPVPGNSQLPGNPRRAVNKTACAADGAEILRENAVCRN